MNSVCYFDSNSEVWAVGTNGAIYQYLSYSIMGMPAGWRRIMPTNISKDLSKVNLLAVHCAAPTGAAMSQRSRRVTIVGSNNTLFYGEDVSMMGVGYTWTQVE